MNVAVLGVDTAGREVARRCVTAEIDVSVHASDPSAAMDAIDAIERHLESLQGTRATDVSLDATTGLSAAVSGADVVIETTTTSPQQLRQRFAAVADLTDEATPVATSRPSVSVTAATADLSNPECVLGLRFHPRERSLVEVVSTDETAPEPLDRVTSLVTRLEATPVVVRESPGLASARLAVALEVEAMRLLEQGIAGVEAVDEMLVTGYDHPMGPLERADRAGLDDRLDLLRSLASDLGDRYRPPGVLADRVAAGKTGVTAGEGFYVWEGDEPAGPAVEGVGPGADP